MPAKPEYRLSVTVAKLGAREVAEENMERFLDAFEAVAPEAGAVMAADYARATLDATFSIEANDARSAADTGLDLFCNAAVETGLDPEDILEVRAALVAVPDHDQTTAELALAH